MPRTDGRRGGVPHPERDRCARIAGLFLIWIGVLGMVLLLGFIALHLLGAAIFSLFYCCWRPRR